MLTLLTLLSGCSALQMQGVWMLFLDARPQDTCQEAVSHNFINATSDPASLGGGQDDPWTVTESESFSGPMVFAQITKTRKDEALLLIEGLAYPGTRGEGETWTFEWEGRSEDFTTETHSRGYSYSEALQETSLTTINLTFDGEDVAGSVAETGTGLHTWSESDTWNDNLVGMGAGQIPVGEYLVVVNPMTGAETTADNPPTEQDCNNEPCSLSISTVCDATRTVSGVKTGYDDEEAYDLLEGYGQLEGAAR